jgi:hypothetical protein
MEPEGSLPHSQEPATCPYSELYLPTVRRNVTLHLLVLPNDKFVHKYNSRSLILHPSPVFSPP